MNSLTNLINMKYFKQALFILTISLGLRTSSLACDQRETKDLDSSTLANKVLNTIDETCVDSWCESALSYQFNDFVINKNGSKLTYTVNDYEYPNFKVKFSCSFPSFTTADSMIKKINSNHYVLQDNFYQALNDCFNKHFPEYYEILESILGNN